MEQLIIKALKSACGNRNFKFQVVIHSDLLHIYVNYRPDYQLNRAILEENVGAALAPLSLETIEQIWLYGRSLGQIEPAWQTLVELPTQINNPKEDTDGSTEDRSAGKSNEEITQSNSSQSAIHSGAIDLTEDSEIEEFNELANFIDFEVSDSAGDTGLLKNAGLIHGGLLKEAEINNFALPLEESKPAVDSNPNSSNPDRLIQYCFVTNKKLLTDRAPDPDKDMIRMVKFFHHLSQSDRDRLLPILDSYFRGGITPGLEKTLPAIQNWFEQIKTLEESKQRLFFTWLSRYCFNPTNTLKEFQAVIAQNVAATNNKTNNKTNSQSKSATEYGFVPVKPQVYSSSTVEDIIDEPPFELPPIVKKTLLPGLWSIATIIFIFLGMINHSSNVVVATAQIPPICNTSVGSTDYCRLAVNLAGEKAISQAQASLFPMTEVTETVATYGCKRYANVKAGVTDIAPETTPVISSKGEKVFPHIYVVRAEQQVEPSDKIQVGCVYATGQGQRSPKLLAADLIPANWPQAYYQKQIEEDKIAFGIYANPINLGLSTMFAAFGIAIVNRLNLGLKINRTQTIYLVALMLGIARLITFLLPSFGLLGAIALSIVTVLFASLLFKDFQFNWSRGYHVIAASIVMIITIQLVLYSFCLGLIGSLV